MYNQPQDDSALTFGVLHQQVLQVPQSSGQVLQAALQVEVLCLQGVDGVVELVG